MGLRSGVRLPPLASMRPRILEPEGKKAREVALFIIGYIAFGVGAPLSLARIAAQCPESFQDDRALFASCVVAHAFPFGTLKMSLPSRFASKPHALKKAPCQNLLLATFAIVLGDAEEVSQEQSAAS